MKNNSQAPALSRGLEILEWVSRNRELSFKELEDLCGYNVSSLNRFLRTLVDAGFLRKNANGRYELGIGAYQLSLRTSFWKQLVDIVTPVLQRVSTDNQVDASLIGYLDREMTVLAKVLGPNSVMHRTVGEAKSDYLLSPWGYLFLAELDPSDRPKFIESVRGLHDSQYELPSDADVAMIIQSIKTCGYADDRGTVLGRNVRRLAAPIYASRQLIGALSVSSPLALMDDKEAKRLGRMLTEETSAISNQIS